jgi:predicted nucleic acid-binding protein
VSGERVLVDTSVWIEYFKDTNHEVCLKLDNILNKSEIYVPEVVIAELIQGAKSEKEISFIEQTFKAFYIIGHKKDTWSQAGSLAFRLKKKGYTIHLIDCYIAVIAKAYRCEIFTLNRHFKKIKQVENISLY